MLLALIGNDSTVVGIVTATSDADIQSYAEKNAAIVDVTNVSPVPQVGWFYDGHTISGTAPILRITRLALLNRFTNNEMMAILAYADNTGAPYCYAIRMILQKQTVATYIDLTRSDTIAGMGVLVAAGLLTSDRMNTILTTPPTAAELYTS